MSVSINVQNLSEYLSTQLGIDKDQLEEKLDTFIRIEKSFTTPKKRMMRDIPNAPMKKKVVRHLNMLSVSE